MNRHLLLASQILVLFFILIQPFVLFGFGSSNSVGTAMVKSNPGWVERNDVTITISNLGLKIEKGDRVRTGEGGQVQITLDNGNSIYIAPNSEIEITELVIGEESSNVSQVLNLFFGKVRAKIQKTRKHRFAVKTSTATIGVKGTDFITEFSEGKTIVGTMEGLVSLVSEVTQDSIDIPAGFMSQVSVLGEVMPLDEFAGELMEGVDFAGVPMVDDEIAGEKVTF